MNTVCRLDLPYRWEMKRTTRKLLTLHFVATSSCSLPSAEYTILLRLNFKLIILLLLHTRYQNASTDLAGYVRRYAGVWRAGSTNGRLECCRFHLVPWFQHCRYSGALTLYGAKMCYWSEVVVVVTLCIYCLWLSLFCFTYVFFRAVNRAIFKAYRLPTQNVHKTSNYPLQSKVSSTQWSTSRVKLYGCDAVATAIFSSIILDDTVSRRMLSWNKQKCGSLCLSRTRLSCGSWCRWSCGD